MEEEVAVEETYQLTIKLPRGQVSVLQASPRESIQDIKQSLIESPETCIYSCFYLSYKGQRLNDFIELGEVERIEVNSELQLVEDKYTDREARIHINRLRDLLRGPHRANATAPGIDSGLAFFTAVTGDADLSVMETEEEESKELDLDAKPREHDFTLEDFTEHPKLSEFVPKGFDRNLPQCLRSLSLSGWNPPPHHLRVRGHLLYLVVTTLENETFHITSSADGFFVSKSTNHHFDPFPKMRPGEEPMSAHSLISLLRMISDSFAASFDRLQQFITKHQVLEVLPVSTYQPAIPWAVPQEQHTFDASRPSEAYLNFGTDAGESLRDWNDELQSHRELPRSTLQERVLRDRLINKLQADFAEAAIKGAQMVIEGNVIAINPTDPLESQMYLYNNIFFSRATDTRGTFDNLGREEVRLHTLASVLIDYKGIRMIAQSVVAGIFRRQDEDSIVYGSVDNGQTIKADPKFHDLLAGMAKTLHLAEHTVTSGDGRKASLYTSVECKGLLGGDGRRYLLDLYRLNPVDVEFLENECIGRDIANGIISGTDESVLPAYPHKLTLLRPELMDVFWETKLHAWAKEKAVMLQKQKADGQANADNQEAENSEASAVEKVGQMDFELSFNPDVFTAIVENSYDSTGALKKDAETIREASVFLGNTIIPALIADFANYSVSPLDGEALSSIMHRRGINIRYLGRIMQEVEKVEGGRLNHIKQLALQEMTVRASKHVLRRLLKDMPLSEVPKIVSHFLNCLLGANMQPKPCASADSKNGWADLTPSKVSEQLRNEIALRYRYLPAENFNATLRKLPVLREICLRVGIQLEARDYDFEISDDSAVQTPIGSASAHDSKSRKHSKKDAKAAKKESRTTTFVPEDILNLVPVTKQAIARSLFAEEAFEAGKMSLAQGHRQLGLELLLESMSLHEQTYGFLHPETAKCYAAIALIYYNGDEREAALDFQRKAVIASEKTCGLDHPETIHYYYSLGIFEHAAGRTKLGLRYLRHATRYWNLVFGDNHPDSATAFNNVGNMLQSMNDFALGCNFFEKASEVQERTFGKDHFVTASGYHILAKAYSLINDFKKAVNIEKAAYNILLPQLGPEDPRTKETERWLKDLTQNAVYTAKLKAMVQSKSNKKLDSPKSDPLEKSAATPNQSSGGKGHLPIDDLIKYIEEDEHSGKSKKSGSKKRTNRKK
ncbi:hypothetical protein BZG36_00998 [Bifiguratus adelaidae]|uniref:Clustered mitochondria protein homolog n=1 Tax=Bifiguratus adelaidae TaxID=1938954 RepID=A0A261Y6G7_9FUNG|nr:hypothetical protein BZG36_00998 [Bifiguratus adelaidae]